MKSYRNLYPQIVTWYNLHEAWRKARKGKRGRHLSERRCSLSLAAAASEY